MGDERPTLKPVDCRREPNQEVIDELKKALALAESGELRSIVFAGVMRDDSVVTMYQGDGRRITMLGALRTVEHEVMLSACGIISPDRVI
jgi:hypothetical protein